VDTTAPTYNNLSYSSSVNEGVTNTIRINTTDATTSVNSMTIDIEGTNYSMTYVSGNMYSYSYVKHEVASDETIYFTIYMNDSASNENATSQQSFTVKNVPSETAGPGGGGPGFQIIEEADNCGSYIAYPKGGFSGFAPPGENITRFYLQIYNGNTSQTFTGSLTGNITDYCEIVEYPDGETPINGYAKFAVSCTAPEVSASGHFEFTTDTGCEDSRPIDIYAGNNIVSFFTNFLVGAVTGGTPEEVDWWGVMLMAIVIITGILILIVLFG
jgi:hypothetical protein